MSGSAWDQFKASADFKADAQDEADRQALERERARRKANRTLDAEELADGLVEPVIGTFYDEAREPVPKIKWAVDGLLRINGRMIISALRKAGKTTLVLNLVTARAAGGMFLGEYECSPPDEGKSVVWLNLELSAEQAREWIQALVVEDEVARRLVAAHLRGTVSRYAPTTDTGRDNLTKLLQDHRGQCVVIDPIAPLMAACGLSINDDKDVAVFMLAVDRIAAAAGVTEVIYIAHIGKGAEEGVEMAKGSSRWEEAVDCVVTMGVEKESQRRWFRAIGRGVDMPEQHLVFNQATLGLHLADGSRSTLHLEELILRVVKVVASNPGILKSDLRAHPEISKQHATTGSAIAEAIRRGLIRAERGRGTALHHYVNDS